MIQVFADDAYVWNSSLSRWIFQNDVLIYDSRLEKYDLLELSVTTGINVGGTAKIVMPPGHPAFDICQPYKTLIRIYRDGELRFRGRVLYPADDFLGRRTLTCEGELCLLRDSINRPYKYQASPRSIFVTIINAHNAQMEVAKQFTVGDVTVVDASDEDYVELENESAETILETLNRAVDRVGGYVTFTEGANGTRVINWVNSLTNKSGQVIEFGENLLDFSSTGANTTNLATAIVPYGAKNETTKQRLTIAAVNDQFPGKDYITDPDAVLVRGTIMTSVVWDDVTKASSLLKKARAYLNEHKLFITSLTLTALDLSYLDKSVDSFTVGDTVRVISAPHGVDEDFQLTQMTEDLLNPAKSKITLGKDIPSLTGSDVYSYRKNQSAIGAVRTEVNGIDLSSYAKTEQLSGYATTAQLSGYAVKSDLNSYAKQSDLTSYATTTQLNTAQNTLTNRIAAEETARKALISDSSGVTHINATDQIKVNARMRMIGSMLDFDNNEGVRIYNSDGNVYYILRTDTSNNTFVGTDSNKLYLRGPTVYLKQSNAVVTSDRRAKHSIEELPDAYIDALDKMVPVRFKYNDGQSDRYHVGFIAQDVEAALTDAGLSGKDFGGFVDLDGDGKTLGLAYSEFIGLLFAKIRKLEEKIQTLEEKQ